MLTGYFAIRQALGLQVPPPHTESRILAGRRRTEVTDQKIIETYTGQYAHA